MINEFRDLIKNVEIANTFAWSFKVVDYETNFNLVRELFVTLGCAFGAIFVVVAILNASLSIAFFIILSVVLTDLYLFALFYVAGYTINIITVNNTVIAVGK